MVQLLTLLFVCFLDQRWWLVGITLTQALAAGSQELILTLSRYVLHVHVVIQFYSWFKFYFPLFLGMVMYDNEFKTKESKSQTKDKSEWQHTH